MPTVRAEFVGCMEDVLDLDAEPSDPPRPTINFDETNNQLIAQTRPPLPGPPGPPPRSDYEYPRHGTRNLLGVVQPQAGWRHPAVTERRTQQDFAHPMKWLVDEPCPAAAVIGVVMDPWNPHQPAALSEAFAPKETRRMLKRLEFHYTPKPGRWLNMAAIELSVLRRPCLDRRIPDEDPLKREVKAYEDSRNAAHATIDWRFTTSEARVKLHRLYPSIPD